MSLDTIRKIAEELGNDDLTSAIAGLESSSRANLDKISALELDRNNAIEKRDRQAKLVKNVFGLEELTEESLTKAAKGDKEPDVVLKAEVEKMSSMTEMLKAEKDALANKYNETVNKYKVEKNLMSLGAVEDTENQRAYDILLNEVTNGATFDEEGNLIFIAKDGTTVRNTDGTPMSLTDRYTQVKDSDDFQFLFKTKRNKSGSGSGGSKGGGTKITSLKGLNDVERTRLFKQDPALFRELLSKG